MGVALRFWNNSYFSPEILSSHLFQQQGLRNWCRQSDFRGLEKWVSQDLRSHRELARDSVSFVVALSKVIDDPTQLSKRYQQMSRSYKVFAKLIGDADAITTMANHEEQQFRIEIQKGPTIRNRSVGHHRKINIEPSSRSRYASVVPTIAVRQRWNGRNAILRVVWGCPLCSS